MSLYAVRHALSVTCAQVAYGKRSGTQALPNGTGFPSTSGTSSSSLRCLQPVYSIIRRSEGRRYALGTLAKPFPGEIA
jgi:hypothetical protein